MARTLLQAPRVEPATKPPATAGESDPMHRRILIVDDNEQQRKALQQLLEDDIKIKADVTSDGSEALKALGQHNYSIVISDLRMPRLDGLQLMEAVQKERIPVTVILMTAHGSIDGAVQALSMGGYDVIT